MTKNKTKKQEDWEKVLAPQIKSDSEEEYERNKLFLPLLENYYEKLKPVIRQLLEKARDEGYECGLSAGKVFAEQARKEEKKRILNELPEERTYQDICNDPKLDNRGIDDAWGYQRCLTEIKKLL